MRASLAAGVPEVPHPIAPVIKYPGSKRWLAPILAPVLRAHLTAVQGTYVETFAGSLAMALAIDWSDSVYSDMSADLVNLHQALARDNVNVADELDALRSVTGEEAYYRIRSEIWPENRGKLSSSALAARTIWINKNCFNGMHRYGGANGHFNVPWGKRERVALPSREHLARVGRVLAPSTIHWQDFAHTLDEVFRTREPKRLVVFLDPPYGGRLENVGEARGGKDEGVFTGYTGEFTWRDQVRVADWAKALAARGALVIVSNAWTNAICDLYRDGFELFRVGVQHSVGATGARRGRRAELLAVSRNHARMVRDLLTSTVKKFICSEGGRVDLKERFLQEDDVEDEPVEEVSRQTEIALPSTIGERISVALCTPGEEYMVDCADNHAPRRMKFREVLGGVFKFRGELGDKVDFHVKDHVFRLPPQAPVAAPPVSPPPPPTKSPCGAPGCGVGCSPGYVVSGTSAFMMCNACKGQGSGNNPAPLPPPVAAPPERKEVALPSRAGNCAGSGEVVEIVGKKIQCPVCGAERAAPKEVPKSATMNFPGHRKPKAGAEPPAVSPLVLPVADVHVAVSLETIDKVLEENFPVPPVPPPSPAEIPPFPEPTIDRTYSQEEVLSSAPEPFRDVPQVFTTETGILITRAEVDILSGLFRDRALAIPRVALAAGTLDLLRRLRLVD